MTRDARLVGLALLLWGFGEGFFFHIQPLTIETLGATSVQIEGLQSIARLAFIAMVLAFPLASNLLQDVRGWRVTCIGMLGSFQALGAALLSPLLERIAERRDAPGSGGGDDLEWVGGLVAGSDLVWASVLTLSPARSFPPLAAAYPFLASLLLIPAALLPATVGSRL